MVRSTVRHETVNAKGTSTAAGLRGEGMALAVGDQLRGVAHGAKETMHTTALLIETAGVTNISVEKWNEKDGMR